MAVVCYTTVEANALICAIYKAIDQGKIKTWRYMDHEGSRYLTHSADQWDRRAWFRLKAQGPGLVANIVPPNNAVVSTEVYAIFHGRFIEMLVAHFNEAFSYSSASAMPTAEDRLVPA
jgi:hypothetical protein